MPPPTPVETSVLLILPLLDPQSRRELGLVVPHLVEEPLGVLAADESLDGVTEREVGREGVVDDGVDDHNGDDDVSATLDIPGGVRLLGSYDSAACLLAPERDL